jgi:hypothetical protein
MAGVHKSKDNHPTSSSALPIYKIKGDSAWGPRAVWRNNTFKHFGAATAMGKRQTIIGFNPYNSDYTPMMEFEATTFQDVAMEGVAILMDPIP